jgi:replicative DNA helicase
MGKGTSNLADPAAERGVLSTICKFGADAYFDVADILCTNSFTIESNQVIWKCVEHIFKTGDKNTKLDVPFILSAAKEINCEDQLENKSEREHLRAIFNNPVVLDNARNFGAKVKKLEIARNSADVIENVYKSVVNISGSETISEILGLIESPIFDFVSSLNSNVDGAKKLGENIQEYIQHLANNPQQSIGIPTGNPIYDSIIGGGFRRKTVNVIGARPKIGKTSLADNIGLHISKNLGIPVLNLDTEMSADDHKARLLSNLSEVPISKVEDGIFAQNVEQFSSVNLAGRILESIPYYHEVVTGKNIEEIISSMRRWLMKEVGFNKSGQTNDCLIMYDYLKLMTPDSIKSMQEYQALGFQMTALHNFAVLYDIPIFLLVQLNRDGINQETAAVASGSDRIIWFCSNFSIFKPKSPEELAQDGVKMGNRKLVPLACRHGPGLEQGQYISMNFYKEINKITEYDLSNSNDPTGFETDEGSEDIPFV